MKHETLYISIETSENGYSVTRTKHIYPKYDRACMVTMQECLKTWIKKMDGQTEMMIDIIGNGTHNNFKQSTIIRLIKQHYGDSYAIVWFGDSFIDKPDKEEFTTKKEAVKRYNELFIRIADYLDYDPDEKH